MLMLMLMLMLVLMLILKLMLISDANSFAPEQQVGHFDCPTSGKPHPSGEPFLWPPSLTSHETHIWNFDGQPHALGLWDAPLHY